MNAALTRLLQLASPALPVGAYTYSQALEWAVEAGAVTDAATASVWINDQLEWTLGRFEAPLLAQMMAAWQDADSAAAAALDARYLASRETAELRAETLQMGHSLRRWMVELNAFSPATLARVRDVASYPAVWSAVAADWNITVDAALTIWLWSWAENQVLAALKTVPLGQAAGQRILLEIGQRIPLVVEQACTLPADAVSNFAPAFAIASSRHETQYSRLFRS